MKERNKELKCRAPRPGEPVYAMRVHTEAPDTKDLMEPEAYRKARAKELARIHADRARAAAPPPAKPAPVAKAAAKR